MITCKIVFNKHQLEQISRIRRKKTCSLPVLPWTRSSAWLGEEEFLPYQRAGWRVRLALQPNCVFGLQDQILKHQSQISSRWFTWRAQVVRVSAKTNLGHKEPSWAEEITYAIYKQPRTVLFDELFNCVLQTIYCSGAREAPTLSFSEGREPLVPGLGRGGNYTISQERGD